MRGCRHSRHALFCSRDCLIVAHDAEHVNAEEWAAECSICLERVEATIEDGQEEHLKGAA